MKRLLPATLLVLFITQADALDFGTLKEAFNLPAILMPRPPAAVAQALAA